jgi:hypothetical protein
MKGEEGKGGTGLVGSLMSFFTKNDQQKVQVQDAPDIESMRVELEQTSKEIRMVSILQKEYTHDLIDFSKWEDLVKFR